MTDDQPIEGMPLSRPIIGVAGSAWLTAMGIALLRSPGPEFIDWLLWLFSAYVAPFIVLRLYGWAANLGAAKVDSSMPPCIRYLVELAAFVFLAWAWWSGAYGAV